jgi:hypothetical protein
MSEAVAQTIQPLGNRFDGRSGQRLGSGIDLNTGQDAFIHKDLHKGHARRAILVEGLILHYDAADELGYA